MSGESLSSVISILLTIP